MIVGDWYNIRIGRYECKYIAVSHALNSFRLKRWNTPKSKADDNRFPNVIEIDFLTNTDPNDPFPESKYNPLKSTNQ